MKRETSISAISLLFTVAFQKLLDEDNTMKAPALQNSELKLVSMITATSTAKNHLVARWQTIDGKLVCQWGIVTPEHSSNVLAPNFVAADVPPLNGATPTKASSTRPNALVAEWQTIDGKLVCRWNIVPASEQNLLSLKLSLRQIEAA
jgi:hypothetical protein